MGVGQLGVKLFSKLTVKLKRLVEALKVHFDVERPVLGVDVRVMMHQVYSNRVRAPNWPMLAERVVQRIRPWLKHGCRVVLVDDGKASNSKVVHFVRRAERARQRNTAMEHLCKVNSLHAQLQDRDQDADALRSRIDDLSAKANKQWRVEMSSAFSDAVQQYVRENHGDSDALAYVRAPFQADPQLVQMFLKGACHAIVSLDGDFLVYGCGFIVHPFKLKQIYNVQQKNTTTTTMYEPQVTVKYVGMLPGTMLEPLGISPPVNDDGSRFAGLSLPARLVCATLVGNDVLPYSFHRFGAGTCIKLMNGHPFPAPDEHVSVEDVVEHALQYEWFQSTACDNGFRTPSAHIVRHAVLSLMFEPVRMCTHEWPFVGGSLGHMSGTDPWLDEFEQHGHHPMLRHCCLCDACLADASMDTNSSEDDTALGHNDGADAFADESENGVFLCHSGHVAWKYSDQLFCDTCGMTFCRPCFLGTPSQAKGDTVPSKCVGCKSTIAYVEAGPHPAPPLHGPHAAILCAGQRSSATAGMDARWVSLLSKKEVRAMVREHCMKSPKDDNEARNTLRDLLAQKLPAFVAGGDSALHDLQEHLRTTDVPANILQAITDIATCRDDWPSPPEDASAHMPLAALVGDILNRHTGADRTHELIFILTALRNIATRFNRDQEHTLGHLNKKNLYGPFVLDSIAHARPLFGNAGAQRLLFMGTRTCTTAWVAQFDEHLCSVVNRNGEMLLRVFARIHASYSKMGLVVKDAQQTGRIRIEGDHATEEAYVPVPEGEGGKKSGKLSRTPKEPYEVVVYVSRDKMLRSFCTCKAGNITCHHGLAVLLQLQLATMSASSLLADVVHQVTEGTFVYGHVTPLSRSLTNLMTCMYGSQRANQLLLAPNDTWKSFRMIECLPYSDYALFVDVCKDSPHKKMKKLGKTRTLLVGEMMASEAQSEDQEHAGGSDDNGDCDHGSDESDSGGVDSDDIGVQRYRYPRNCYWSRSYSIRRNFWNRDCNDKITFNYVGFLQRWKGKTADPREMKDTRAFFTETPLFWAIVVRAIRQNPKDAFEALKYWIHEDELMQILTDNTDSTASDAGSTPIPEVAEVQDAVRAPPVGAARSREACGEAPNPQPQKKKRSGVRCAYGLDGVRCRHVQGIFNCKGKWITLPRHTLVRGTTWKDVDPAMVYPKIPNINQYRKKCLIKPVVAKSFDGEIVSNAEAVVKDALRQLRVCGCHTTEDGTISSHGPRHAEQPAKTPSKGTARTRAARRCGGEESIGEWVNILLKENEELKAAIMAKDAELAAKDAALAERDAVNAALRSKMDRIRHGTKYSNVQSNHCWWRRNTHFSCSRHFDMFVDFLTDGEPGKLRCLHVYNDANFEVGKGYTMPEAQSRHPNTDYRTEFMMYFAFEVTKECAAKFFDSFGISDTYGMCLIRTYAMLLHEFSEAFGRILSWQEQAVMMPTQWREWFGLDQARVDPSRPWDPAAVDVETTFSNGGRVRRPSVTDTTNVPLSGQPRSQEAQAQCFNRYYNGWVAKAAVCALPMGWVYAPRLMAGGVGDSVFLMRSGVAEMQRKQVEEDGGPPFLIVADKGNRQHSLLWQCGEQELITPTFGRKGVAFSTLAMLRNVSVAKMRIFNECVISRVKMARFRVAQNWRLDAQLVELLWRNYVFRCNAVYMAYSKRVFQDSRERVLRLAMDAYLVEQSAGEPEASS